MAESESSRQFLHSEAEKVSRRERRDKGEVKLNRVRPPPLRSTVLLGGRLQAPVPVRVVKVPQSWKSVLRSMVSRMRLS